MSGGETAALGATAAPRMISSRQTFFAKFVLPTLWIGIFGAVTLALWLGLFWGSQMSGPPLPLKWTFLAVLLVGGTIFLRTTARLKRVRIDGDTLLISNYRTEIRVPVSDIVDVTENRALNHHPVTITLRHETEFGRTITFMPKVRPFLLWRSHPVVPELRELASGHRQM